MLVFPECSNCRFTYNSCTCHSGVDHDRIKFTRMCNYRLNGWLSWNESNIKFNKPDIISKERFDNAIKKFVEIQENLTENEVIYYLSLVYSFLVQQRKCNTRKIIYE